MTLNEECVRDVLIYCKNNIDYRELQDGSFSLIPVTFKQLLASPLNQTYNSKDIMYTVMKLEEIGFIKISNRNPKASPYINECLINEITYVGHKFIDATEPEPVWDKTKNIVGKVGNHTLEFVEGVAHDVAVEFAKVVAFKQG